MKDQFNKVTGNWEKVFNAELLSVGDQVKKFNNEKQTEYRNSTIRFADANGKTQQVHAVIYESSYRHGMKLGEKYMATASPTDNGVFVSLGHLAYSEEADSNMFGKFSAEDAPFKEETAETTNPTSFEERD